MEGVLYCAGVFGLEHGKGHTHGCETCCYCSTVAEDANFWVIWAQLGYPVESCEFIFKCAGTLAEQNNINMDSNL